MMCDFPVALQLYSIRDDMVADFAGSIKRVKKLGYDGVEFAGLFGHTAEEVKKICADAGITPISAHVSYHDMMNDDSLLSTYAEIGCKYVVVPYIQADYLPGGEHADSFARSLKALGKKANSLGMKLGYHNHDFEFETVAEEYKLDLLYRQVPAELLISQLDTCWVNVGGENPADYIRKYSGRVEIVHLKDFVGRKNKSIHASCKAEEEMKTCALELRPLGKGVQDFPAMLEALKEADTKWLIIEQDSPSMGKTPLECAEISINYLRSIF